MDEPFIGIDPGMAREIRAFLKAEVIGRGRTVLLATHMLDDVEQLCNKAALMSDGRILVVDTLSNLKGGIKQAETITLEVTGLDGQTEALFSRLRNLPSAREMAFFASRNGVSTYRVRTANSRACLPALIDTIYQAGGKVRYVRVISPTLEDVFLHYTGKRLSEGNR